MIVKRAKYPRIERIRQRKKNTCAKCACGEVAKYQPEIEVSYMRGDDVVVWACGMHKKDHEFLLENYQKQVRHDKKFINYLIDSSLDNLPGI